MFYVKIFDVLRVSLRFDSNISINFTFVTLRVVIYVCYGLLICRK